jgi:hypothetical protein
LLKRTQVIEEPEIIELLGVPSEMKPRKKPIVFD